MNSKTLNININNYCLIRIDDIYNLKNANFKMYAILSFKRFIQYFFNNTNFV